MDGQQGPTVQHGNYIQCPGINHNGKESKKEKRGTNELIYSTEIESWIQETNLWLPGNKWGRDKLGDWD